MSTQNFILSGWDADKKPAFESAFSHRWNHPKIPIRFIYTRVPAEAARKFNANTPSDHYLIADSAKYKLNDVEQRMLIDAVRAAAKDARGATAMPDGLAIQDEEREKHVFRFWKN